MSPRRIAAAVLVAALIGLSGLALAAPSASAPPTQPCSVMYGSCPVGGTACPGGVCGVGVHLPGTGPTGEPVGGGGDGGDDGGGHGDGICHNTVAGGCNPCTGTAAADAAACAAYQQSVFCASLVPGHQVYWTAEQEELGCPPPGTVIAAPPPDPGTVAKAAEANFRLIKPSGHRSPSETQLHQGYPVSYTNVWTYFWTDPDTWRTQTATATVTSGGVTVTAVVTARPVSLTFDPGDGHAAVSCAGPGRPAVAASDDPAPSDGVCGYRYTQVSGPGLTHPFTSTQTITYDVTWTATGSPGGRFAQVSTSTAGPLNVLQIQSIVVN
jgi:hypothetical protein